MPAVINLDVLITAARSRSIRLFLTLQSDSQLEKSYSQVMSKIIKDATQSIIFTYISPKAPETAETLSKMLGEQTVKTGSVTHGQNSSVSYQMMGRRLLTTDEITRIPKYHFITAKAGQFPVQTVSPLYFKYTKGLTDSKLNLEKTIQKIRYLTVKDFLMLSNTEIKISKGMFD